MLAKKLTHKLLGEGPWSIWSLEAEQKNLRTAITDARLVIVSSEARARLIGSSEYFKEVITSS